MIWRQFAAGLKVWAEPFVYVQHGRDEATGYQTGTVSGGEERRTARAMGGSGGVGSERRRGERRRGERASERREGAWCATTRACD
jgi:hypothetical protein